LIDAVLDNFGAKGNFIILYFLPPPCLKIVSEPLRRMIFIDAASKFIILQKKLEYCSQHIVLHYEYHSQTKLFSPSYLLIRFKVQLPSEYVLKIEFKP